jgi:DNA polymerase-3 subunit epsilon
VKKSRKTNLNTIEHSAKVFFNGHYIRKWMRRLFKLKIVKRTDVKRNYFIHQLTRGKNSLFRITDIIYVKNTQGLYQTKAACFQYKIKECDGAHRMV